MKTTKVSLWLLGIVVLPLVTILGSASATVPPEWLVHNYLYHSVGQTPGVVVEAPVKQGSGDYVVSVLVVERTKREALATLLVAHIDGLETATTITTIRVVDWRGRVQPPLDIGGTTKQKLAVLKRLFGEAFRQNRLFHKVETSVDSATGKPEVYHIFNDLRPGPAPAAGSGPHVRPASDYSGAFDLVLRSVISDV